MNKEDNLALLVFVDPACGLARHSCYNFSLVYVHASVRTSVWICSDNNLYNNACISKQFWNNSCPCGGEVPFDTFF